MKARTHASHRAPPADPASAGVLAAALAEVTNASGLTGSTESALRGADVFIGLSGGCVAPSAIAGMAPDAIVFALSNPDPEVHPGVRARTPGWWPRDAATSRTRSTTCWPSPVCSAARSTSARRRSPRA